MKLSLLLWVMMCWFSTLWACGCTKEFIKNCSDCNSREATMTCLQMEECSREAEHQREVREELERDKATAP